MHPAEALAVAQQQALAMMQHAQVKVSISLKYESIHGLVSGGSSTLWHFPA